MFLSSGVYSLDKGKVHGEVLAYTKEILEASTLSEKAKRDFYEGVEKGLRNMLDKVESKEVEGALLVSSLKDLVRSSLLWRLSGSEVRGFVNGFGELLLLGFSPEGSAEIVKRLIVKEIGFSVLDRMLRLLDIAINKYGSDAMELESHLREKLSMLISKAKGELTKEILDWLRGKVEEAKSKHKRK